MSEQRELKPGAKIYHREYGHGWVVPSYSPASDGRDVWAVLDGHEGRRRMRHRDRSTLWDLADSHGPHNVGRVLYVEQGPYAKSFARVRAMNDDGKYRVHCDDHPIFGIVTPWAFVRVRWATPQEQAKYYEERGGRVPRERDSARAEDASPARPDPHLTDRDMLCESGCGVVPHRYRPSIEAGPYWRCSECGKTTGSAHEMEPEHGRPDPHPLKVGDRVRLTGEAWKELQHPRYAPGTEHVIGEVRRGEARLAEGGNRCYAIFGIWTAERVDPLPTEAPPAPHADCPGCGGDPAKHGHYTACMTMNMADQDEPSAKYAADLAAAEDEARARALYNLRVEYAALGRGPYPESCLDGADARSVLWGDHGKR